MDRLLVIVILLAFAGGYADAASYLLTGAFAGQLTGNVVLTILHLLEGNGRGVVSGAAAVSSFVVGLGLAEVMGTSSGAPEHARQMRAPLLAEGVLLLLAMGCRLWRHDPLGNDLSVVCLCLGLGLQNGALRRCGGMAVHTTFITGLSTTLLTAIVKRTVGTEEPEDKAKRPPGKLAGVLAAFVLGVGTGGWACGRSSGWGLAGLFVPLLAALVIANGDPGEGSEAHRPSDEGEGKTAR